ncbi:conserved Plasmodium protein, unknown function [Plasmodium berghei]|uniref:Uncharacterized protein n=2 Tax=Plasmodium berghei TaxID=5821 RepID=A0A509ANE1_PLABA|nr:conserved Plasmodium protein, unknown function [Plasmodium berghei ANKA]CXI76479.1 conserved Plasmodium protein, unknown function [Plasmodium berghei]SCN27211.1 conserved Plasmodium protein, unknown function [Plasmodium berghei]SCO61780.1 conserved Plasmodium protein, unknown function [Plasmodium berghei]VUC57067.1 conserved Plasmodium protein, unknown function [Plasmodium berghei ANKA]|eukprot:XP_034422846.1 conserved Plasmodium protein, unknown function [Plasmodium berghei ANKA]
MELHKLLENKLSIEESQNINTKDSDMHLNTINEDDKIATEKICVLKIKNCDNEKEDLPNSSCGNINLKKKGNALQYYNDQKYDGLNNALTSESFNNIKIKKKCYEKNDTINLDITSTTGNLYHNINYDYIDKQVHNLLESGNSSDEQGEIIKNEKEQIKTKIEEDEIENNEGMQGLKHIEGSLLFSSFSNDEFMKIEKNESIPFHSDEINFIYEDEINNIILSHEQKICTFTSLLNDNEKKEENYANYFRGRNENSIESYNGNDNESFDSNIKTGKSCKECGELDSEDDKEIKNILNILQNLRDYNFNDTNAIDNDDNYENMEEKDELNNTEHSYNCENENNNNKKHDDTIIHDKNIPFLGTDYIPNDIASNKKDTDSANDQTGSDEDKDNIEHFNIKKLKDKYKKYVFSLSDHDEYQQSDRSVQSQNGEEPIEETYYNSDTNIKQKKKKKNESDKYQEDGNSSNTYNIGGNKYNYKYINGMSNSDMNGNPISDSNNNFDKMKNRKKKKKKETIEENELNEIDELQTDSYDKENPHRNLTNEQNLEYYNLPVKPNVLHIESQESWQNKISATNDCIINSKHISVSFYNHEIGSCAEIGKERSDIYTKVGDTENSNNDNGNETKHKTNNKKEIEETWKPSEINNDIVNSTQSSKNEENENSEQMRKKKLIKENINILRNDNKNLKIIDEINQNINSLNFEYLKKNEFNLDINYTNDTVQNVSIQKDNNISEKIEKVEITNNNLLDENLNFDYYLKTLHNLKSRIHQEISGNDSSSNSNSNSLNKKYITINEEKSENKAIQNSDEISEKKERENDDNRNEKSRNTEYKENTNSNFQKEPNEPSEKKIIKDKHQDKEEESKEIVLKKKGGKKKKKKRHALDNNEKDVSQSNTQIELVEKNIVLKNTVKDLQNQITNYKKMEKLFDKNKKKYKNKLAIINEYEKKIDCIIIDFNKLKDKCANKEKKISKLEEITKYMNEQFSISKIQFENKMNEYVIFLKKKDSEIYMLKELIKEKEKVISFNENILKQYKADIDDMLKQNIERVEHVKNKLKIQQNMISEKDLKITKREEDIRVNEAKINAMENKIKALQNQIELEVKEKNEFKKNYEKENKEKDTLSKKLDEVVKEKNNLHYKIEELLKTEKNIIDDKAELLECKNELSIENEKIKFEINTMIIEKEKMEEKYNLANSKKEQINNEMEILKKTYENNVNELEKLQEDFKNVQKNYNQLKEEKDRIEKSYSTEVEEKNKIQNILEATKNELETRENQKELLQIDLNNLQKYLDETVIKNEDEIRGLKKQLSELEAKLEEANNLYFKEKEVIEKLNKEKNKFIKEFDKLKNKNKKITSKMKETQISNEKTINDVIKEKNESLEKEKNKFTEKVQSLEQAFQESYNELHCQKKNIQNELEELKIINQDIKNNSKNLLNVNDALVKEMKAYNIEKEQFIKGLKNIKEAYIKIKNQNQQLKKNAFSFIQKDIEQNYVPINIHNTALNEKKTYISEIDILKSKVKKSENDITNLFKEKSELSEKLKKINQQNEDLNTNIKVKSKITEDIMRTVEKLKSDIANKEEEIKKKTLEIKKMEREYKTLLDDYKMEKKNLIAKYENELDEYMNKCEFAHSKYKKYEEEVKEMKSKLKMKDEILEYTHKEIENIKESFCKEYEHKIQVVIEEKDKEIHAMQKKFKDLNEENTENKNEIAKLGKMLEDANKKIKKRDMEMYILLDENKKQKEKAAKKMNKVNELLNNLQKEYTDNIP